MWYILLLELLFHMIVSYDFVKLVLHVLTISSMCWLIWSQNIAALYRNHVYILYKKNCTRCMQIMYIYKMYTKCIQNASTFWKAFAHILYINLKEQYMAAKSSIQNVYKSFLKCGICGYFVYYTSIMIYIYTKST